MNKKIFMIGFVLVSVFSEKLLAADSDKSEFERIKEVVCNPDEKFVPSLLEKGIDVNTLFSENVGVLQLAIFTGADIELIKKLIEQGININNADVNGSTALVVAACGASVNLKRYDYYLEVIKLLIKNGAQINVQLKEFGSTPLTTLCSSKEINGLEQLIQILLEGGADTNIQEKGGYQFTALHCAIRRKASSNIISLLLKFGANPDIECNYSSIPGGASSLHLAIQQAVEPSIVELLLKFKANPNKLNSQGFSPLNIAIAKRDNPNTFAAVKMLLEYGADPEYTHPSYGSIRKIAEEILGKNHPTTLLLNQ